MKSQRALLCLVAIVLGTFSSWRLLQVPREDVADGIAAYAVGDAAQALVYFESAAAESEHPQLLRNLALAALAAQELERAATAADALAQSGQAQDLAWRDFLLGNVAWQRSRSAEFEAHSPVPPAGALERAIAFAEQAQAGWLAASERRASWPEAERNLQRVAARLSMLREELAAGVGDEDGAREKMATPDPQAPALDPAQQQLLMDQLERLDLQDLERRLERRTEPEGGWEW